MLSQKLSGTEQTLEEDFLLQNNFGLKLKEITNHGVPRGMLMMFGTHGNGSRKWPEIGIGFSRIGDTYANALPIHLEDWLWAGIDYDVRLVQFILRADQLATRIEACSVYTQLSSECPGLARLDANAVPIHFQLQCIGQGLFH